jgi:methylase of polypeptide subunit release factors
MNIYSNMTHDASSGAVSSSASASYDGRGWNEHLHDSALIELGHALKEIGYQFTTVTPLTHSRVNARPGNQWAKGLEDVFGWSRPFQADVIPANIFAFMQQAQIIVAHENGWRCTLRASTLSGELFFHSAYPTSDSDAVFFGPDTYRFVDAIERHLERRAFPVQRAVDIGCGAGAGAISLGRRFPTADVFAVDINDAALRLTGINAALAETDKVSPLHSDLLSELAGTFDLIVANPPYLVDPAQRAYRHGGGPLGMDLSLKIVDAAVERLRPGGTLLLYTGTPIVDGVDAFRQAAEEKLRSAKFISQYREIDPDVFGEELASDAYSATDRIAAVVLTGQAR